MPSDAPPSPISARLAEARRFNEFVQRYRRPLVQYFRHRAIDTTEAHDLVQIVFLRLLQKLEHDPESLSDAYVFTAASSVLIDHHRRKSVNVSNAAVEIDPDLASCEPDSLKILEDRETLRVMLEVLSNMRSKWRRVFIYHRFDQLSYAEIANKMGMSVSSVEKYVMTALAELKEAVDRGRHD